MTGHPTRALLALLSAAAALSLAACGGGGSRSATAPAQTPIEEPLPEGAVPFVFDHHLWFEAAVNDSLRCNLIFDTGNTTLFLDSALYAARIGSVARLPDIHLEGAGNGTEKLKADLTRHTYRIGGYGDTVATLSIVGDLRKLLGYRADGMFGMEFMQGRKAEFNFSRRYLRFLPDEWQPDSTYTRLGSKWLLGKERMTVPLRLAVGETVVEGDFLLDMGCGVGLQLTSAAARRYRLDACTPRGCEYHTQTGGVGGELRSRIFLADSLRIGSWSLPRIEAQFSRNSGGAVGETQQNYLGLLGTEILSRFDLIIDFASGEIWLRPGREFDAEPCRYSSRISLTDRRDLCDGWIVNGFIEGCPAREAGLDYGDTILQINGRSPREFTDEAWRQMLSQPGGLTLTVKRGEGTQRIESRIMEDPY